VASTAFEATAYTVADQQRMSAAKSYFAWQARLVLPEIGQRVVEVGCGLGNFTEFLLDREAVLAFDKEPSSVDQFQRKFRGCENIHALMCDASAEGAWPKLSGFRGDSCVCLNVLEHIEGDAAFLSNVSSVLAAGGVIVLLVPAFPSLYGPIDRNLGHFRRYTMRSLRVLATSAGLHVKKAHYVNAAGFFGWWLNSHVFAREAQSENQIAFFDRYLVPIVSRLESVAPPPFGQSIFAVLQKP
jgi:SAM-dependent methyltransferase